MAEGFVLRCIRRLPLVLLPLVLTLPLATAGTPKTSPGDALVSKLREQIRTRNSAEFKELLKRWEKDFGTRAVEPLIKIAQDRSMPDPDRYIALMGSAKLGGQAIAPKLLVFLKDRSWMVRNGALRALTALKDPQAGPEVLKLLRDPALVVRLEAVAAVEALQPPNAATALLEVLSDKANYHGNKAQWVPIRALEALAKLGDKSVAKKLGPLLDKDQDPELQKSTVDALERITGRKLEQGRPLSRRAAAWKRELL